MGVEVHHDGWASASFSAVGDHHDSEDDHHDSEDGQHDSEGESSANSSGLSLSLNSPPQTGDTTADGIPVCALLILLSLVSIVVVKRRAWREQ